MKSDYFAVDRTYKTQTYNQRKQTSYLLISSASVHSPFQEVNFFIFSFFHVLPRFATFCLFTSLFWLVFLLFYFGFFRQFYSCFMFFRDFLPFYSSRLPSTSILGLAPSIQPMLQLPFFPPWRVQLGSIQSEGKPSISLFLLKLELCFVFWFL